MKETFYIILVLLSIESIAQEQNSSTVFVDPRDNNEYQTVSIEGTVWMAENLNFKTDLSISSEPQKKINPKLTGRYYHLQEISNACPSGWRLPSAEDWFDYFTHITKSVDSMAVLKVYADNSHFAINGYHQVVNPLSEGNVLQLTGTGRVEGDEFKIPENYADYWTADPPKLADELPPSKESHIHVLGEVYEGKTHIHIRNNAFANIHSHKHHLNPKRKKKLRMFMIRCVKDAN